MEKKEEGTRSLRKSEQAMLAAAHMHDVVPCRWATVRHK